VLVILLAIADEDVVLVTWDYACHLSRSLC